MIRSGERPLHALRERGVEYVEVRLMDLDPFETVGINATTMRFLDVFLLHCVLSDSAQDTPNEIAALARNQHLTAAQGREPGLKLDRNGEAVSLVDWGLTIIDECLPIARSIDAALATGALHVEAVEAARRSLQHPTHLPSARVLRAMADEHENSFVRFVRTRSVQTRDALLAMPLTPEQADRQRRMVEDSVCAQREIETSDTTPFEEFRKQYVSAGRLVV